MRGRIGLKTKRSGRAISDMEGAALANHFRRTTQPAVEIERAFGEFRVCRIAPSGGARTLGRPSPGLMPIRLRPGTPLGSFFCALSLIELAARPLTLREDATAGTIAILRAGEAKPIL